MQIYNILQRKHCVIMMFGYELFHNEAITIDDLQVKFSRVPKLPQSEIFILKSLIPLP